MGLLGVCLFRSLTRRVKTRYTDRMAVKQQPWDRLDGESDEAYTAFQAYRDAGNKRSVALVESQLKGSAKKSHPSGQLSKWSATHNWCKRASAYDDHLDRVQTDEVERQVRIAARQCRKELREVLNLAVDKARALLDKNELDARSLPAILKLAADQNRLDLGMATDKVEVNGAVDPETTEGLADIILSFRRKSAK